MRGARARFVSTRAIDRGAPALVPVPVVDPAVGFARIVREVGASPWRTVSSASAGEIGSGAVATDRGTSRPLAGWVIGAASAIGLGGFFYPFLLPAFASVVGGDDGARFAEAPVLLAVVTGLCLAAILAETGGGGRTDSLSAGKTVALLAALVAVDATLRLAPTLLGASPIFALILLVGAVFGPSFGFLMGALTLLVSAFLTGGLGPWLPYQMLGAGWVGMSAGWLPRHTSFGVRLVSLAGVGAISGLLYGALLNLYSWPFAAPALASEVGLYWSPGLPLGETLQRYGRFYLVTSLPHDLFRAVGNAALILVLGGPILRLLERFRIRFAWHAWTEATTPGGVHPPSR
jgi:energy-coupling factor transport system substrate-specific component